MRNQGIRESLDYGRSSRTTGQVNAKTLQGVFPVSKKVTVDEHEYHKMMREREARIRTFMQLELEACLEELNWMIRCHNCEALNCPRRNTRRDFFLPLRRATLIIFRVD